MIYSNRPHAYIPGILLTLLPAIVYGCSHNVLPEEVASLKERSCSLTKFSYYNSPSEGSTLDILAFENDIFKRLDSYMRVERFNGSTAIAESTGGDKIFFFCLNGQRTRYDWTDIQSYNSLQKIRCDLEKEGHTRYTMTGECCTEAGRSDGISVEFTPLISMVRLESLSCDFSGTAYADKKINNIKVYLTNVNADCEIFAEEPVLPERIINAGRRCWEEIEGFKEPSMVSYDYLGTIGNKVVRPDIKLRCYPNNSAEESPGSPFTRLVIEGKIQGQTYYWPIDINREGTGNGIGRNRRYIYDIEITRKGSDDPDIPVRTEMINIKLEVEQWKEKEEYGVIF
jgi:hypothetical protein